MAMAAMASMEVPDLQPNGDKVGVATYEMSQPSEISLKAKDRAAVVPPNQLSPTSMKAMFLLKRLPMKKI
jgi:hypothetical protein